MIDIFNRKKVEILENRNYSLRRQINQLENQCRQLQAQINSKEKELIDFQNTHKSIVDDYENKIKELQKFIDSKKSQEPPVPTKSDEIILTDEMQRVLDLVNNPTAKLIFVHGSAGTGKSTLLKYICDNYTRDDFVLLAPTGIAALNIDGATIHSFFQIPPTNIYPSDNANVSNSVEEKLQNINFIIIDEISMVRADLFDKLNYNLQYARNNHEFFGGVKLLLIGDLYQLPPVLKKQDYSDYEKLGYKQDETFFFYSNAIKNFINSKQKFHYVELTHIFRQNDKEFINVLQKCRLGKVNDNSLEYFQKRFVPITSNEIVNLVTTNAMADNKNTSEYQKLLDPNEILFNAKVSGIIPKDGNLPAPATITLKIGTQVIITANESDYKNGTIGTVAAISKNGVSVKIEKENRTVFVTPYTWEYKEYVYDKTTDSFELTIKGTYTQIPLKYGWAITIHKSQGLTLDSTAINFGRGTFCTGQGYVAVSRVRSVNGLYFLNNVRKADFKADSNIDSFLKAIE
ncbi:MAG: AAA family ATPase [Spirochaetaceae bacterium]|nr:AAA family ATPase [Spirochaetaceae bacterium]